jgi:LysM repeat protein
MFSPSTLASLLALTLFTQSAIAADCQRTYKIQPNDFCDQISGANNVSTYQLAAINADKIDPTCSNLKPYDTLCLGYEGEDCKDTYVVKANDTCDMVSNKYGLNSTVFRLNNPQINSDCTNMYIDEVMCVSKQVQVPPPPAAPKQAEKSPAEDDEDLPFCDEL